MPPSRRILFAGLALILIPTLAHAHAILIASTPAGGAAVPPGKTPLTLRFNSRIDHARSRLALAVPGKPDQVLSIDPASPDDMLAATATLAPGPASLRWQVLAVDGHITRGEVALSVRADN